jgi:hypothetical protein
MIDRHENRQAWIQATAVALTSVAAVAFVIIVNSGGMKAGQLQIEASDIRSRAAATLLLTDEAKNGHLPERYQSEQFDTMSERTRDDAKALESSHGATSDLDRIRQFATEATTELANALNDLKRNPWEDAANEKLSLAHDQLTRSENLAESLGKK